MGSKWKNVKMALGLRVCAVTSPDPDDLALHDANATCLSTAAALPALLPTTSAAAKPSHPNSSLSFTCNSFNFSRTSCSICLEIMKPGLGHALFTAECSHTFHFSCIASSARYGNLACPVCRAKWKEVPWQAPREGQKSERSRASSYQRRRSSSTPRASLQTGRADVPHVAEEQRRLGPILHILDENIANAQRQRQSPFLEPNVYNDDEPLIRPVRGDSSLTESHVLEKELANDREGDVDTANCDLLAQAVELRSMGMGNVNRVNVEGRTLEVSLYPDVSVVAASEALDNFTVLVHLKTPSVSRERHAGSENMQSTNPFQLLNCDCRTPLDLVTVLDISGSMAGTKLALLKRAMGFVIQNLSCADRLSVVVFSTGARRIFPLRRMGEEGQQQAFQAIDALVSSGGTNIAEGLRKGTKVLEDRRERNPVSSIILLSDGQDTYTMTSRRRFPCPLARAGRHLTPGSIRHSSRYGHMQIPVHTFGFGADHDAATMHTISQVSGGTFSFIQAEGVVQDAFAQCIGGLLSVVIQDVQLKVYCAAPDVQINKFEAGSYESSVLESATYGSVKLGDLYAEEERDVLVELKLPPVSQVQSDCSMPVLQVVCTYKDPVTQEISQTPAYHLCVSRPLIVDKTCQTRSLEVDRQRNRLHIAKTIAEAGSLADRGDISEAQQMLQSAKALLHDSPSAKAGDHLCSVLDAELSEIQVRMANMLLYERSGRAYLLSAQSSHSQQRATTRGGGSTAPIDHSQEYQTPYMVDMLLRSQTLSSPVVSNTRLFPSDVARPGKESINHGINK